MRRVVIESPYAGDVEANIAYARRAMCHSIHLGEAPIASHLLYTQEGILNDLIDRERTLGIMAGLAWLDAATFHVFYTDRGWSRGMLAALRHNLETKSSTPFLFRALDGEVQLPPERIVEGLDTLMANSIRRMHKHGYKAETSAVGG